MGRIDYDSIADLYDLYVTADYDREFFLREVSGVEGRVLELMAGTGRLSVPLIEAGARLTCVDASRSMLDVLARKLVARGLDAELHCMDVRQLSLPGRFELAIAPFHSFMELVEPEDRRAALDATFGCLSPGGRFVCTLHNPTVRRVQVDGVLRVVGSFPASGGRLVVSGIEQGGHPVVTRLQFFERFDAEGRMVWKRMLPMEFALVDRDSFERQAVGVGFRVRELFGEYDRSPFDPEHSPAMVWVLERPADGPP